jgi:hypothetical protein
MTPPSAAHVAHSLWASLMESTSKHQSCDEVAIKGEERSDQPRGKGTVSDGEATKGKQMSEVDGVDF